MAAEFRAVAPVATGLGFTLSDVEARGGEISYDQPMPNDPFRMGRLRGGEIDAIFDEGVIMWADLAAGAGAEFLPLSERHLDALVSQGFRRGLLKQARYPSLPGDIPTVDFSGRPISLPRRRARRAHREVLRGADQPP